MSRFEKMKGCNRDERRSDERNRDELRSDELRSDELRSDELRSDERRSDERRRDECHRDEQEHVHEILGSVEIAEREEDPHNHRFATVSGEAIRVGCDDHVHDVKFRTDFYEDHFHEFCGRTEGAVWVGDRHVHFLKSATMVADGHCHKFRVATLIDDPIGD